MEMPQEAETILVVEDEEEVRNLISRILENEGYSVLAVGHPAEAVALSTSYEQPIDLLLADLSLPTSAAASLPNAWARHAPR